MARTKRPTVDSIPLDAVKSKAGELAHSAKGLVDSAQNIQPEDVIQTAMKVPGVRINRETFLRKELFKYYPENVIECAIENNPAYAGIDRRRINAIARQVIDYETNKVTAVSVAAGLPGGTAMLATVPADLAQYFGFMIRVMQKLAYLYGFPDLELNQDHISDETMNKLLLFLGAMYGVTGAHAGIKFVADAAAKKVSKSLAQKALTKGAVYPIVKKVAQTVGIRMTKQIFAGGVSKVIPVIGGVVNGGLSYATFKPCAISLKNTFKELEISDPEFYKRQRRDESDEDYT